MIAANYKKAFWIALAGNMIWINVSEIVRYFALVRPMLNATFPGVETIGAVTPSIFLSWMVWDTILIFAATGFFWLYLKNFGTRFKHVIFAATAFTITVFGLLWLGVVNMGLAPAKFLWAALPFAWLEQVIAAFIVRWAIRKAHSSDAHHQGEKLP